MNIDFFFFIGMGELKGKQVIGENYFGYVMVNMRIKYLVGDIKREGGCMRMELGGESGLEIYM